MAIDLFSKMYFSSYADARRIMSKSIREIAFEIQQGLYAFLTCLGIVFVGCDV